MLHDAQPMPMPMPQTLPVPPPSAWWPPLTAHHRPDSRNAHANANHHSIRSSSSHSHSLSNSASLVAQRPPPRYAPQQTSASLRPAPSNSSAVLPWSAILSPTLSISHFRLGELLGRGATSEVYAAFTDLADFASLSLAIKRIPMLKLATQKDIARVQAEIQTQLIAQHPSIVRLYAAFRDHEHVYLVLELCESGTLADYLEARGKLTEPEVRYVLDAVIRGLLYLRRQGKYHRDVKPGNIMLTADNDVKIGDLGLVAPIQSPAAPAAAAPSSAGRHSQQQPPQRRQAQHTVCGTINYMAPEVVANQPYSETVDMWSLGCLLVTMLKGRPPFEPPNASAEDSYEVRIKTLRGLVEGHYTLPRDLSKEVRDLIASLLQKNPERRMTLERILEHSFFAPGLPVTRLPREPIMGQMVEAPIVLDGQHSRVGGSMTGRPVSSIHDAGHAQQQVHQHRKIEYSLPPDPFQVPPIRASYPDSARAHHRPQSSPLDAYSRPTSSTQPPRSRPASARPPSIHSNPDRPLYHHPPPPLAPAPQRAPPADDLVPIQPLSTRYLRPISHSGQTVSISLRPPPSTSPSPSSDVDLDVHITSKRDGTHLTVRPSQHGLIHVHFPATGESRTFTPSPTCRGLPRGLIASLYEGALKFVAKARAVSPRVTLYSPQATVALMVNGDVDARFADRAGGRGGVRVKLTGRHRGAGELVQVWQGQDAVASGEAAVSAREWGGYVAHVRMAARQCEAALAEHEAAVRRGEVPDANAPLVIKTAAEPSAAASAPAAAGVGRGRTMSAAPSPPVAGAARQRPAPGSSRAPSTARSDSGYFTSHHGSSAGGHPPPRRSGSVVSTRSSVSHAGSAHSSPSSASAASAPLLNMYVPAIGWFSRHPGASEQYTLMFLDGALVTVHHSVPGPTPQAQAGAPATGWVKYAPPPPTTHAGGAGASLVQPRMYPLTQGLPMEVKERLGQYRVCVAEFRRLVKEGGVVGDGARDAGRR